MRVLPPHGEPVSPEVLSRGTQEQLYLALRLAHIRNHAAQAAALPVIMDDVLVNFDPDRACVRLKPSAIWLLRKKVRRGISFCTSLATRIWRTARKAVPGVGLYVMERGTIREEE